jgi:hypothetical protein
MRAHKNHGENHSGMNEFDKIKYYDIEKRRLPESHTIKCFNCNAIIDDPNPMDCCRCLECGEIICPICGGKLHTEMDDAITLVLHCYNCENKIYDD